jgi:hypothetical protein
MIVNHHHSFLFVHIHKTAGSSVRAALKTVPGSMPLGYPHTFIKEIDTSAYRSYFKFAIVRNPWARLVSWYYSILDLQGTNALKQYVTTHCSDFSGFLNCTAVILEQKPQHPRGRHNELLTQNPELPYPKSISFNQLDYISDAAGNIAVDYIGRFESLEESWAHICRQVNISATLPHKKWGSWRAIENSYRAYYKSAADIEKVRQLYARDIAHFDYKY